MTRRRSIMVTIHLTGFLLIGAASAGLPAAAQVPEPAGFGVVVSADGHILVPYETINGCSAITSPTLGPLRILHIHEDLDLALLQAPGGGTPHVALGDARAVDPWKPMIFGGPAARAAQAGELARIPGRLFTVSSSRRNALYMSFVIPEPQAGNAVLVLDRFGGIAALVVHELKPGVMLHGDSEIWAPIPRDGEVREKALGEALLRGFLDHQDVAYASAPAERPLTAQETVEHLRTATTLIECR